MKTRYFHAFKIFEPFSQKINNVYIYSREMWAILRKYGLDMFHSSSSPAARLLQLRMKGHMNPEYWRLVWSLHHSTTHSFLPIHIPKTVSSPGHRGHGELSVKHCSIHAQVICGCRLKGQWWAWRVCPEEKIMHLCITQAAAAGV